MPHNTFTQFNSIYRHLEYIPCFCKSGYNDTKAGSTPGVTYFTTLKPIEMQNNQFKHQSSGNMKEVRIKYTNPETLAVLEEMAKYFDLSMSSPKAVKTLKIDHMADALTAFDDDAIDVILLKEMFGVKTMDMDYPEPDDMDDEE